MRTISALYRGVMAKDGSLVVTVDGRMLPERLDLRNHSPTGFGHGYGRLWTLTGAQVLGAVEVLEGEMRGRTT